MKQDSNAKLLAAISYFSIVGLIVLLIEKKNKFVLHHAKQGTALFAMQLVLMILAYIPFVNLIVPLISLVLLVAAIYGIILAIKASEEKMPLVFDLGQKIAELLNKK